MPGRAYYAVQIGWQTGVFPTWEECQKQTRGFPGATYQKFTNQSEAAAFVEGREDASPTTSGMPSTHTGNKRALSPGAEDQYIVYSDGACRGNGKPGAVAGIGVWWDHDDPRNLAERCPGDQTNNCAELVAIVRVLETAPTSTLPLIIKTDSEYSCSSLQLWLPTWEKKGYRTAGGQPVKNIDLILYVKALMDARKQAGQNVKLDHVRGHRGITGNEGADALAVEGATMPLVQGRNWKALERDLRRKMADKSISPKLSPAADDISTRQANSPNKARRISIDEPHPFSSVSPSRDSSPNKARRRISIDEPHPSSSVSPSSSSSPPPVRIRPIQLPFSPSSTDNPKSNFRSNVKSNPQTTEVVLVVDPEDIDLTLYVDCLLEEHELWKDLLD